MAQAESNLVEGAKRLEQKFENFVNKVPTPKATAEKVDTSWHDKQVEEANKSFARKEEPAKSPGKRKVGGASKDRMIAKNTTSKAMPRKASAKKSSGL